MEKIINRPGCIVHYDVYGDPKNPAVVLLHGYGVDARMWQPQLAALLDYYVLVPDVRGHGRSRPCQNFTVPDAADDVHAILKAEGCLRFTMVGLSMGGYITQEYALRYGGAAGYFIIGATPIFLDCYNRFERYMLKHSAGLLNLYPWKTLKKAMTKACAATVNARNRIAPLFDTITKQEFVASWQGIATSIHLVDMQFDAPLLVACGQRDHTGSILKCMKAWQPAYPGCQTLQFQNASHVANLDTPNAFNATMLHFIQTSLVL